MPETVASVTLRLSNVDSAIARAERAQAYGGNGRNKSNANLETLYKERRTLQRQLDLLEATAAGRNRRIARIRVTGLGDC